MTLKNTLIRKFVNTSKPCLLDWVRINGLLISFLVEELKPDFGDFRSAFADDAADQLVGDRHLVRLLGRGLRTILGAGEGCQSWKINFT